MPETREIVYEDETSVVHLVVRAATALDGMQRALLQGRAAAYIAALDDEDTGEIAGTARRLLANFLYPDLLAVVTGADGLDVEMDVATFLDLPEGLTDAWQNAVYELNPHWYPFRREDEDETEADEKKVPDKSASASSS